MRAAFAKARTKSTSRDKDHGSPAGGDPRVCHPPSQPMRMFTNKPQQPQQVRVKIKSISVESNQTLPCVVRCPSTNSYDDDAISTSETPSGLSDKTRTSSQESLKQQHQQRWPSNSVKSLLAISPLRPSLSTSCLFSSTSSGATDEPGRDCEVSGSPDTKSASKSIKASDNGRGKQQSASALICIPTRASLTHEWRKLKTPNKCRECNLLVYFNGRECSACGFVAHKKCITMLVIKCNAAASNNRQGNKQALNNVANATAQSMSGIGAAFFSLRNPNIRPFGNLLDHNHHQDASTNQAAHNPIFGQSIVGGDSGQLLDFVNRFVYEIDTRGLTSKGIYRVSSIKSKVDKLCNYFDQNPSNLIDLSSFHPNIIANALKLYLRKLPEPLLTNELYESFINIARRHSSKDSKADEAPPPLSSNSSGLDETLMEEFKHVVNQLPATNKQLAAIILRHLRRVADMAEENQMSSKNLSIIFGPTLLSAGEQNKSSVAIVDNIHQARLIELMINWAYQIFPHAQDSTSSP